MAMFHRVLAAEDPRWSSSLAEWSITDSVFDQCLEFFTRHYNIVSLDEVRSSLDGGAPLPPCSLLITFDDGYSDNHEYALPLLRRRKLPAVVFVVSDSVDRMRRPWQEEFFVAWSRGEISPDEVNDVFHALRGGTRELSVEEMARDIAWRGPSLSEDRVSDLFRRLRTPPSMAGIPRQMLTGRQLRDLQRNRVAVGAHGRTHVALPMASDPDGELALPRLELSKTLDAKGRHRVSAMSFPHGQFTAELVQKARSQGYELLFTSRPCLNHLDGGRPAQGTLGRLNVSGPHVAPSGSLRPELLALSFFRARHEHAQMTSASVG